MEIKLTEEECLKFFHNAMCNYPGYGNCRIGHKRKQDYIDAKEDLILENKSTCIEDIWLRILEMGNKLVLEDQEDPEQSWSISLQDVFERMPKVPLRNLYNMAEEQDDADDADTIIQTIFIGEVIFG